MAGLPPQPVWAWACLMGRSTGGVQEVHAQVIVIVFFEVHWPTHVELVQLVFFLAVEQPKNQKSASFRCQ